jgi:glycosyltransferase involved in cell wall biosynthesis
MLIFFPAEAECTSDRRIRYASSYWEINFEGDALKRTSPILRVLVATPLGTNGRGGIDRLNDSIFEAVAAQPYAGVRISRLVTRGQRGLFVAQFVFAFALTRLFIAAMVGNVNVLHIHLSIKGSSYRKTVLGVFARLLRIPYVIHLHGSGFDEFWSSTNHGLARAVDKLFLGSTRIVVLGRFWATAITNRLPNLVDRIDILPNATMHCQIPQERAPDKQIRVSLLGELGVRKGTGILIEALGRLAKNPDWIATIAGNGAIQESRTHTKRLGIADRVSIPGWLESSAAADLLRRTDIFVLPSFSENLPMAIIEAFAHGVAVISTPVGAIPEVIDHGRNGILVPVGNIEALTDALILLIGNPELRYDLGKAAQADHAKYYELEGYVARLVAIWRQAAA